MANWLLHNDWLFRYIPYTSFYVNYVILSMYNQVRMLSVLGIWKILQYQFTQLRDIVR